MQLLAWRPPTQTAIPTYYHAQAISQLSNLPAAACKPCIKHPISSRAGKKNFPGRLLSQRHLSSHCSARRAHQGPDRSTHILASHPPVLKGNGRTLNGPQWDLGGRLGQRVKLTGAGGSAGERIMAGHENCATQ